MTTTLKNSRPVGGSSACLHHNGANWQIRHMSDLLSLPLAHRVTSGTRGTTIDRTATFLRRHMRSDPEGATPDNEIASVITLVRSNSLTRACTLPGQHGNARVPFLLRAGGGHLGLQYEAVSVFGQDVANPTVLTHSMPTHVLQCLVDDDLASGTSSTTG